MSRELDGGSEREGKAPSGNLRGIEDLVHSYPPTSRPRPAESSLGLNAPIPFPMTTFGPIRARGVYTYIYEPTLPPRWCLYHLQCPPRVGNAVGYLVDIVYLGCSPSHDLRDFSLSLFLCRPGDHPGRP